MRACVRACVSRLEIRLRDSAETNVREGEGEEERVCVCVTRNYAYIYYINIYHCAREKKSCKSETS